MTCFQQEAAVLRQIFLIQGLLMMYICSLRQFGSIKSMFHGPFDLFYFQTMIDNDLKKSLFET